MRRLIPTLLLALSLSVAQAQETDPYAVLGKAYAGLSQDKGATISFTATSLQAQTPQGSLQGTIKIKGRQFALQSDAMLVWFDGRTQWSMQPGDSEVNITEPTAEELRATNPYSLLALYKDRKAYACKMKQGTLSNGKQGYRIFINALTGSTDIREVFAEINPDYTVARISFRQGKDQWTRINVNSMAPAKLTDADFTFPSAQYPSAVVNDLR